MLPPVLVELLRLMPPPGSVWTMSERVKWFIAFDAAMCLCYGGDPRMIWVGADGEIHIAEHPKNATVPSDDLKILEEVFGKDALPTGEHASLPQNGSNSK